MLEVPIQILNNNDYDYALSSHQLANDLREIYDLPLITAEEKISSDIITNLNGFLNKCTSDLEENAVDVIKGCRENIS